MTVHRLPQFVLWVVSGGLLLGYGLMPLIKAIPAYESDIMRFMQRVGDASQAYSFSDLVVVLRDEALIITTLTPPVARRLAAAYVEVLGLRDLPGILPIVFLLGLAGAAFRGLRQPSAGRAAGWVSALIAASGATMFYLWLWGIAADHDLAKPTRDGLDWTKRGYGLAMWRSSLWIQILIFVGALAAALYVVRDYMRDPAVRAIVAGLFCLFALALLLIFRPEPYFRLVVLSWWPLSFGLALVATGLVALRWIDIAVAGEGTHQPQSGPPGSTSRPSRMTSK